MKKNGRTAVAELSLMMKKWSFPTTTTFEPPRSERDAYLGRFARIECFSSRISSRRRAIIDSRTGRGARVKAKPDPILAANQKGRILRRKERRRFLFVEGKETEKKISRRANERGRKNPRRERETRASIERSHKAREEVLVFSLQREVNREDRARERPRVACVYLFCTHHLRK